MKKWGFVGKFEGRSAMAPGHTHDQQVFHNSGLLGGEELGKKLGTSKLFVILDDMWVSINGDPPKWTVYNGTSH